MFPCLGSRLLTGAVQPDAARALTDDQGVTLAEAMRAAGRDPGRIGPDERRLEGISALVELHIEQGRALAPLDAAVGVAEGIWPHGRWRLDFTGRADHAGTARLADRRDPMLPYASTVLAARQAAAENGAVATFGKVMAEPNGTNAVPSAVRAWLDARAPDEAVLAATVATVRSAAEKSAREQGVTLGVRQESSTPLVRFDEKLRDRICGVLAAAGMTAPVLPTGAGHDAGVLAARCRPPCCSCATRPASRIRPPNTPIWPTARPESAPWPPSSRISRAPRERRFPGGTDPPRPPLLLGGLPAPPDPPGRRWLADLAWLPAQGVQRDVLIEADGGHLTSVTPSAPSVPAAVERLHGLTLPGFANAHSHAFHRALRGTTQADRGTFWTWRERMYDVAARLDPDRYLRLARATYAEMALAGVSCVGEFHYLHHQAGGHPYDDPNAMGRALIQAAAEAGLRMTLLDTCYLAGGLAPEGLLPLAGPQLRFGDGDAVRWAGRVTGLGYDAHGMITPHARVGAAIHSVRAVPRGQMHPVVAWAHRTGAPLHAHMSEQTGENEACQDVYGMSPARLLYDENVLGPRTTVVHATHLEPGDLDLLGGCQAYACLCPTTERDLGDGLAPARALAAAGCPLTLGSDSHAVIDLLEEARGVEYAERLAQRARGHFTAEALLRAATAAGHTSLGWPDAGEIAVGARADLVTIGMDSVRTAGAAEGLALETAVFGASAADVRDVVISGRDVVRDGVHLLVPDVPGELSRSIRALLG